MPRVGRRGRRRRQKQQQLGVNDKDVVNSECCLLQWMCSNGFNKRLRHVSARNFLGTGRGLMALKSLKSGDIIVSVPRKLLITSDTVLNSFIGPLARGCASCRQLTAHNLLSVFLLYERFCGKHSFWFPYINSLPSTYTTPLFWPVDLFQCLPSTVQQETLKQSRTVLRQYDRLQCLFDHINNADKSCHVFTVEEFKWAWTTVNSRCVYLPEAVLNVTQVTENTIGLIPFLDLLNHSPTVQVSVGFDEPSQCYVIKTESHCSKYSQVFINYGAHCNKTLLVDYGFIVTPNSHDCWTLTLDGIINTALTIDFIRHDPSKIKLLKDKNLDTGLVLTNEGLSWNLKSALLVLCSSPMDVSFLDLYLQRNISTDLDKKMNLFAKCVIEMQLKGLTETHNNAVKLSVLHIEAVTANKLCKVYNEILNYCPKAVVQSIAVN